MSDLIIKIGVITLGCPKNTADTENILGEIPTCCQLVDQHQAEIVILNTCAFLAKARAEVLHYIKIFKTKKIILIGCFTGLVTEQMLQKYPQIFAVVSGKHYPQIGKIILETANNHKTIAIASEPKKFVEMKNKTLITPLSYAYVKIAEGCNNNCTFCLIPKLKGQYRSRSSSDITQEIKELLLLGVKEIILVAQDCGNWGKDLNKKYSLTMLLKKIISLSGDFQIRLMYLYPERITDSLIELMVKSPKIYRYLDIPFQHGDADILKAMNRPFNVNKNIALINKIRKALPNITLRTSIIVGFPGETAMAFANLIKFIKKIKFDHLGVFEYSREKGTKAFDLSPQISDQIKYNRYHQVMLMQQKISLSRNQKILGRIVKVLIEDFDQGKNIYIGRSAKFAPEIDGLIFVKSLQKLTLNDFYNVKITKASNYDLEGFSQPINNEQL